jgi:hypothetical protein
MARMLTRQEFGVLVRNEIAHFGRIQPSDRHWSMPFAAALSSGTPLLIGAYFGHLGYGLVSSLGGMVFLYLPPTPLQHRMIWLMACAFGLVACYTLGLTSHLVEALRIPLLVFIAVLVMMCLRFYSVGPPGGLFFIMAAAIGAYTPVTVQIYPTLVGLNALGCLLACAIAFVYSLYSLRLRAPEPVPKPAAPSFDVVIYDPVVIGAFVGISLGLAQLLRMPRPYWVPVSCLAVIQGASLRAVWTRQLQRIVGTLAGVGVAWVCLASTTNPWGIALLVMALAFVVETIVVRHYGMAAVFFTPLTILLADAAGSAPASALLQSRLFDTVLGSVVGLLGGLCLHHRGIRASLESALRALVRMAKA